MNRKIFEERASLIQRHARKLHTSLEDQNFTNKEVLPLWSFIAFHRYYLLRDMKSFSILLEDNQLKSIESRLKAVDAALAYISPSVYKSIALLCLETQSKLSVIGNFSMPLSCEHMAYIVKHRKHLRISKKGGIGNLWRQWWRLTVDFKYEYIAIEDVMTSLSKRKKTVLKNASGRLWVDLQTASDLPSPWEINSDFRRFRN